MHYYNEIDPYCCEWLLNLMAEGLIPTGYVDRRSIKDVRPEDLEGFVQCHFFAGIAGWPLALRLAGWPEDRAIWTGSCPCQPFSLAGKQEGFSDDRDLWPDWYKLVCAARPTVIMGEQVASAVAWRTRMRSDLEHAGYDVGSKPIQAASAGACQLRDRLWFVACRNDIQRRTGTRGKNREKISNCSSILLARERSTRLEGSESERRNNGAEQPPVERNRVLPLVHSTHDGWGEGWTESEFRRRGFTASVASIPDGQGGTWQFIECPDGKYRRLPPPEVRWLGNGIPARVDQLRAFGNSIYPPAAAEVIRTYMDIYPAAEVDS